jgi:hypothetical protein
MKRSKSTSLAMAVVSIGLVAGLETWQEAQSSSESPAAKIVIGEVSQVEGEFRVTKTPQGEDTLDIVDKSYVVTDQAGRKVRLKLDNNTKIEQWVNPGDRIEAKISSKGDTLSVTRLER